MYNISRNGKKNQNLKKLSSILPNSTNIQAENISVQYDTQHK